MPSPGCPNLSMGLRLAALRAAGAPLLNGPEGPPSGAPYSNTYRKAKEIHELIFSWLSWLAVFLGGAYARRDDDDDDGVAQHGGHNPNNRFPETYSLDLHCTSLILDIHAMIN